MAIRCLTEAEAASLGRPKDGSKMALPSASAASEPSADAGDTSVSSEPSGLVARLVEVKADVGDLPLAKRKLAAPRDAYAACVQSHGGIEAKQAEVQIRFLVRDRGRAEGASVAKRRGMSQQAAQCIAEVVDRRPVGIPDEPLVGATATIVVEAAKAR